MGRPGAVGLQSLRDDPQKNAQHHVEHRPITLHEVAQPLWHRQNPLAHRQPGENVIRQVRRRLHHAPRVARGAHAPAFAGIGHEVVVSAVITPGAGKAVGKDAAFEVFAKRLADIGLGVIECKPDALSIRARLETFLGLLKQLQSILLRHRCGDRQYAGNSDLCLWHDHCGYMLQSYSFHPIISTRRRSAVFQASLPPTRIGLTGPF